MTFVKVWIGLTCLLMLSACATNSLKQDAAVDRTGELGKVNAQKGAGEIYVKMAVAYMQDGQLDIALHRAKKALIVEPDNALGHNVIALLYSRLGEYPLAEKHFLTGLKLQPKNPFLLNAYGTFLCDRGRFDEADTQFQKSIANPLYKTPELALTNAGMCMERIPNPAKAESYLRLALERNPRFAPALLQMGQISLHKEQYLSARGYLQRYLAVAQHNAASLWLGIQVEQNLGDRDSVASYSLLLKNNYPDSNEAKMLMESQQK